MIKRIFVLMLAALLSFSAAAETAGILFSDYAPLVAGMEENVWAADGVEDIQVLTVAEGATVSVCLNGGEIAAITVEAMLDSGLMEYARSALEPMNVLDEATLAALETLPAGEMLAFEGWMMGRIAGETREGVFFCAEADYESLVWQAMHGGDHCHSNPNCSGLDIPRLVTGEAAEAAQFERCDHCDWEKDSLDASAQKVYNEGT